MFQAKKSISIDLFPFFFSIIMGTLYNAYVRWVFQIVGLNDNEKPAWHHWLNSVCLQFQLLIHFILHSDFPLHLQTFAGFPGNSVHNFLPLWAEPMHFMLIWNTAFLDMRACKWREKCMLIRQPWKLQPKKAPNFSLLGF